MNCYNIAKGDKVNVFAGTSYNGEIVEVLADGFWLTEDYEMEEYILFIEVESLHAIQ
ncbi:hypothetical protein [Paenisporosarcina sp. NPDC076898]|uniref:hypothetical protein n=1 Tax=unclassified Paenisporosarcina TaxID=2642018 RepID=UPI003D05D5F0